MLTVEVLISNWVSVAEVCNLIQTRLRENDLIIGPN